MKRKIVSLLAVALTISLTGCVNKETRIVIDDINSIGEVTLDSGNQIKEINQEYDNLDDDEKADVNNYDGLKEATEKYNTLYAEDLDNRIKNACNLDNPDKDMINKIESEYNGLDDDIKKKVKNASLIEKASNKIQAKKAYTEIIMMDYTQSSEIYKKIQENIEYFNDEQKSLSLLYYGQAKSLDYAIEFIMANLKSPKSFNLYDATYIDTKVDENSQEYYTIYSITYGATNSFGAEVTDTSTVYCYYTVDEENGDVEFSHAKYSAGEAFRKSLN